MASRRAILTVVVLVGLAFTLIDAAPTGAVTLRTLFTASSDQEADGEEKVVTAGDEVEPPRKTKHVTPVYPPEAKEAGIEGVVTLDVIIGPDGLVKNAKVVRSVPELDAAAIEAVSQWEFEPTYVKGKKVSVRMTVTVNFTLAA